MTLHKFFLDVMQEKKKLTKYSIHSFLSKFFFVITHETKHVNSSSFEFALAALEVSDSLCYLFILF